MTTSKTNYTEAFVWIWLPNKTKPVVAGKLQTDNNKFNFTYGKSYLERINDSPAATSIYEPELPLQRGALPPANGLTMASCLRDAAPDAWGRRIVINKLLGLKGENASSAELNELTYLLESGSDRIGNLDFQPSASLYEPRSIKNAQLEELLESASRVEKGIPLTPDLDQALFLGSSIGGARPKALIEDNEKKHVAKFSSSTDLFNIVKTEYVAMKLAKHAGLSVASVKLVQASHKDVLLIKRFDREKTKNGWRRKGMVSALTLLGLDEMMARYASYESLAEIVRRRFANPKGTLKELFSRIIFNILCGNTDDHARNHAAFWDGKTLDLTPAYDICPQNRAGNEATQAMLISGNNRLSQVKIALDACNNFLLDQEEAHTIIEHQIHTIETRWDEVCDEANLNQTDRKLLMRRQFLNPFALQ